MLDLDLAGDLLGMTSAGAGVEREPGPGGARSAAANRLL